MSGNTPPARDVIVYADGEFIPEDFALRWVRINDALGHAETWGDIRRTLPELYADALAAWEEYREGYEEDNKEPYPNPPSDDAPCDMTEVPPEDGSHWRDPYGHDKMDWVASDLFARFGKTTYSMSNGLDGDSLVGDAEEIAAALREHGFTVRREDDLVRAFHVE